MTAAAGRDIVDFGSRRAHGTDAALKVARAAWLVGAAGTSNVLAAMRYRIPVFGTMAHSYIQAHDDEQAAFAAFVREFDQTTLLVDTYDTLAGVRKVIELARRLGTEFSVGAIRLDSGDLAALAFQSRRMLDDAGLQRVRIFASSELDEQRIAAMVARGVPIDAFGVGTRLAVSLDAPDLDMAYKLVEYGGVPRTKLSTGKVLYPGAKQVFRNYEGDTPTCDVLGRFDERQPGAPLMRLVMRKGRRQPEGSVSLNDARRYCREQLARLPEALSKLGPAQPPYPLVVSPALKQDLESARQRFAAG
jgi:nicotinate phosphoribosyltransferase